MAGTVTIAPSGHTFVVEEGETVLECALRAGLAIDYGCTLGTCGKCKARVRSGRFAVVRPVDYVLKETDRQQGYTLLCAITALTDLVLEAPEAQSPADIPLQQITTRVQRLALARRDILRLYLRTPRSQLLRFFPGQYLTWKLRDLTRDVPIASCPCDGLHLEFHLRYHPGDPFSERVFHGLQKLDRIEIEGPKGRFTLDEASRRPILWVAFDTGFGPIHSLIEHAIHIDLAQPMHLYWHVPRWGEHYMENYCRAWVSSLEDFVYTPLAGEGLARGESGGGKREICSPAEVARRIVADYPDLSGYDLYLVAPDSLVAGARDRFLAHGLPPERLFVAPHYL